MKKYALLFTAGFVSATTCANPIVQQNNPAQQTSPIQQGTFSDARLFLAETQTKLEKINRLNSKAAWVYNNFITDDSAEIAAHFNELSTAAYVKAATDAAQYNDYPLDPATRRKLDLLRMSLTLPAPQNEQENTELATIQTKLEGMYGKGKYCTSEDKCLDLTAMSKIMATSRDADELLDIWQGWRQVSPPMRPLYEREVELANKGAQELGFANLSQMWRSKYDMPAEDFPKELDRLWGQVKPLYDSLQCHVKAKLGEHYGEKVVPQDKPIPAHLLGNMWAQTWGNIYDLVKPEGPDNSIDLTKQLEIHNYDELKMVKTAENFFSSLGFAPLPETFYQRSLFIKPVDHNVVCHASAWDLDDKDDIRIKMCIQKTGEDFSTIHHELGHNYYQRAYKDQPLLFRGSANDGFHEAVGDTIALSITPQYLKQIGLIDKIPDPTNDLGMLMRQALDKIAFLPFGLLVDQWRWKVFAGDVAPEDYNKLWWELREKYQGVRAPIARDVNAFDPGAKYHIPGNVPYTRYFLAFIQQFQFHKALCEIADNKGPIHRCSIYGSKAAGKRLKETLAMGLSRPWQEAMEKMTGQQEMDASAILDYFAPLKVWLDQQNKDRNCG
ncbi:M2 family metallopeptidase [Spartinivicinus marinus]|uniref:M2 family metallopeptidase n=1 Tax=Spartinivicinus marinus TaxID=2994442 RepID=UPI0022584BE4|nr:M2 family metallopeptidase [Spartinivicinus marinus]